MLIIENSDNDRISILLKKQRPISLINELAYSHEELAKAMGKSRPYISNALRLLQLPKRYRRVSKWQTGVKDMLEHFSRCDTKCNFNHLSSGSFLLKMAVCTLKKRLELPKNKNQKIFI